jgi:hypothetical protein
MILFRNLYIRNSMTVFTAVIFLNMSFFLAEVSALKLDKDKKMIANIAKLISTSAAEEERDVFGATDEDHAAREVDLIYNYSIHTIHNYILDVSIKRCALDHGLPILGNYEIFSPPPEA